MSQQTDKPMCNANDNAATYDKETATPCGMRLKNLQRIVSEEKLPTWEYSVTSELSSP